MALSFDQSKDVIARLVQHFTTNKGAFLAPAYKEAHARQELIDPFFVALNWDVQNRQHAAPDYREVIVEDSLEIAGQKKAPDYAFRIGRERKFFGEAKKPGVDIKGDPLPAYQLRRYAWSAKLPLSLLTDFEELAVYDCRIRPAAKDKATVARVNYLHCAEYPDRWREVWDVFSREAVYGGSFDQFATEGKGKRGTSEVDAEFLKEIEGWRDALARNIALRNPKLTIDQLNDAVQRTIDRIIFLRMAEDRGIEEYGRLQHLAENDNVYAGLLKLARQADDKYNSGLFDLSKAGDRVTPGLTVDDKAVRPILADLYFPHSPYEFSVMPAEILGNVYEQFLGKVIRLTAGHQAKVEEKPEVKKAGGVKYTPTYIVEYIVRNTVGPAIEGKGPAQLKGFTVLDPACGSGSFLLVVYAFLLDHYLAWYTAHEPEKHKQAVTQTESGWRLTLAERKRILTEHVYGVDLDRQAVEVTKLSLLLKVLEGAQQLTLFAERALPNLDANIKWGNSLVGPDYFTDALLLDAETSRVITFDWAAEFPEVMRRGGFTCIVGNPPYIRIHNLVDYYPGEVKYIQGHYAAASFGKVDIYVTFIEKGLELLKPAGRLGYIVPNKFMQADYGVGVRKLLARTGALAELVDFGNQQVFDGATTYTCLLFLSSEPHNTVAAKFNRADQPPAKFLAETPFEQRPIEIFGETPWQSASSTETAILEKLNGVPTRLGDVVQLAITGVKTGANNVFVFELLKSTGMTAKLRPEDTDDEVELERTYLLPYVKAESLKRYYVGEGSRVLLYPYTLTGGQTRLVPEMEIKKSQKTWQYLVSHRKTLEGRQKGKLKGPSWYGLSFSSALAMFTAPKIVTPTLSPHNAFAIDTGQRLFPQGAGGGAGLVPKEGISAAYLLGLLNSRLLTFFFQRISSAFQSGWFAYEPRYLERIPIRLTGSSDKAHHDQIVGLVGKMMSLHSHISEAQDNAERTRLQRLIDATDKQIDALVYELYELTPEEIAIVEGNRNY